ncbi:MAG: serine hydrolase domain-containing protein [Phycisphaerales bacterium]
MLATPLPTHPAQPPQPPQRPHHNRRVPRRVTRAASGAPHIGIVLATIVAVLRLVPMASVGAAQPASLRTAVDALIEALTAPPATAEGALDTLIERHTAPDLRQSLGEPQLRERITGMRSLLDARIDDVSVEKIEDDSLRLTLIGGHELILAIVVDDGGRFGRLDLLEQRDPRDSEEHRLREPIAWDTLEQRLQREQDQHGLSGVVLAERDGREVLRAAYGLADHDANRPTDIDSIYGIGSKPIEFTIAAIFLLAQRDKLALDDSIAEHLPDVPTDKRAITIAHLMSGRSGLPDFFHTDEDWDPDLAWIDRTTAEQRILAEPLHFEPGTDRRHSHAAFGLLAAIVERIDGRTYQRFVTEEILGPAGMTRTGFYGQSNGLALTDFAVGKGVSSVGIPNIPPNWGPTSWLIMGSGGMYSTIGDIRRFHHAIDNGRLLNEEHTRRLANRPGIGVDGSDRGYEMLHATDGKGNRIILIMNMDDRSPARRALMRDLIALIDPRAED